MFTRRHKPEVREESYIVPSLRESYQRYKEMPTDNSLIGLKKLVFRINNDVKLKCLAGLSERTKLLDEVEVCTSLNIDEKGLYFHWYNYDSPGETRDNRDVFNSIETYFPKITAEKLREVIIQYIEKGL